LTMITVLLDTNALLLPHQHGVDVFSEIDRLITETHETITLSTVAGELKALADSASEDGVAANVGLRLLEGKKVKMVPSSGPVDDAIVEYAASKNAVVCTNDRDLKRRLKARGVRTIAMRGKTHLEMR